MKSGVDTCTCREQYGWSWPYTLVLTRSASVLAKLDLGRSKSGVAAT